MHDPVFRALADPTRRRIRELLAERDRTAGESAERFPIAFASVSHHLGLLKTAAFVVAERDGQHVRYRLNAPMVAEVVRHLMTRCFGGADAEPRKRDRVGDAMRPP